MRNSILPATPMKTLSIPSYLRIIVKIVHFFANIFKFWDTPREKAAADFEEMSLPDMLYWGYKSKHPVRRAEKGSGLEEFFATSPQAVELPTGFEKKKSVTLSAVGDLYKIEGIEHSRDLLYENIAALVFDRDIRYANLESQVTKKEIGKLDFSDKETPPLHGTKAQYNAMKGHGSSIFNVMQTANNHTLDMELEGVETTREQLEKDNILELGTNRDEKEQRQGRIIEKNGLKIGFVSATYGLNGKPIPEGKKYLVNVVKFHQTAAKDAGKAPDLSLLMDQIAYCKEQACDVIIAGLHWGYEYELFPRKHQVDIAHELVEAGVDLVIGHHAHVIQPVEFYHTQRDPNRTAVIIYSLGNLTSPYSAPHLVKSQILDVTLAKGFLQGKETTYIEKANIIPVIQEEEKLSGRTIFRLKPLT